MKTIFKWLVAAGGAILLPQWQATAGRVRTLYASDRAMQTVKVAMGRSTVLRFDEKPKNVIIGNQNYFSAEYLANDVTIQPLGRVATNAFIYTESQTYGLILSVGSDADYDDLVYVRYKPSYVSQTDVPTKRVALVNEVSVHRSIELPGVLHVEIDKIVRSTPQGLLIVEMRLENISKDPIQASDVQVLVTTGKNSKPFQTLTVEQDTIAQGRTALARLIVRAEKLDLSQMTITCKGTQTKFTFPKRISK